jgi:hypothetical protein
MRLCDDGRILELVKSDNALHLRIVDDRTIEIPFPYHLADEIIRGGTVQLCGKGCHCKMEGHPETIRVTYSHGTSVSSCHVPLEHFSHVVHQVWHAE